MLDAKGRQRDADRRKRLLVNLERSVGRSRRRFNRVRLRWSDAHLRARVPLDLPDTLRYPPLRVGTARALSPVTREDGHFARVPVTSRELQHARSDPKTREVARRNALVADRMDIIGFPLECQRRLSRAHTPRAVRTNGDFDAYWRFHLEHERQRIHQSPYTTAISHSPRGTSRRAAPKCFVAAV